MSKTVLITGSNGLCGSALTEEINRGHLDYDFYFATRNDADLVNPNDVKALFDKVRPNVVIHTAAKVGGIGGNTEMHADFFYNNILMNTNIIKNCIDFNIDKLLAFSSVCVFPDDLSLLEESKMHQGPVFESNFAYGYAKRMVDVYIRAAKLQHGVKNYCSIIPGNIFGKHDMFSIDHGHIIPALMHKLYLAKQNNTEFIVWGDGKSLREFIYVNDLAKVLLRLLAMPEIPERIIVSGEKELSIQEVAKFLVEVSDFKGITKWDTSKPNGQRNRPSSKKAFNSLIPDFQYSDIKESLKSTWDWFINNYPNVRCKYND
tara:strand:+ start:7459 stop:8409 length:951 start_codon:yes stop_codon:yes gene_type:complete